MSNGMFEFRVTAHNAHGASAPSAPSMCVKIAEIRGGEKPDFTRRLQGQDVPRGHAK